MVVAIFVGWVGAFCPAPVGIAGEEGRSLAISGGEEEVKSIGSCNEETDICRDTLLD